MMKRVSGLIALALMACSFAALGQDLNEIVVTGSRSGWHDLSETPAISITKPGDFLLQKVRLVNDTRDDKARHDEIYMRWRLGSAARSWFRTN